MKGLIIRLCAVPMIAFFPMLFSVAIIGSFWDIRNLDWLFPNNNAWQVYIAWIIILAAITITHYIYKKRKDDKELE